MTDPMNLKLSIRLRWWVRPTAFVLAIVGFVVCLVAPKTGAHFTTWVITRLVNKGVVFL